MALTLPILLKAIWMGLSGALGAGARHSISSHSRHRFGDHFPWGTLFINVSGAFVIGGVSSILARHVGLEAWRGPVILGFLGGYTTFSTLMLEVARLRQHARHMHLALYLAASIVLGPLAAFLGLAVGRWF